MARRRAVRPPTYDGAELPPELLAGPVVELWLSPDELPPGRVLDCWVMGEVKRRFRRARQRWADANGVGPQEMFRLIPDRKVRFADMKENAR